MVLPYLAGNTCYCWNYRFKMYWKKDGKTIGTFKALKTIEPDLFFGLQPQGVFLIRNKKAEVIPVEKYNSSRVPYATQSAPMLVMESKINPQLPKSTSRYIRNGVGILPVGRVLLIISKQAVTFQQSAGFFIENKCTSAPYLDEAISEVYTGENETYVNFGLMIAAVK